MPKNRSRWTPGIYTYEVDHAEDKIGRGSCEYYIVLRLRCVDNRSNTIFDTLSYSPKSRKILNAKLYALGQKDAMHIGPEYFVGRKVDAAVIIEHDHKGVDHLIVDSRAKGSYGGYFPIFPT